jgi:hypothetical protein
MGEDFDASWRLVGPRLVAIVTAAQLGAARDSSAYVGAALAEQGIRSTPDGTVAPGAFAGVASSLDGLTYGSLDDLLYGAVVNARSATADSLSQRLAAGRTWLDTAVHTQVADAGRMASSTDITSRPRIGWTRMVNPPCCQRCAALAGKFFRSNTGFQRHPRCDCRHVPSTEAAWDAIGVRIGPEDVTDLTIAQRRAIGDGADMNQVVNSHRAGARSADLMTTNEGVTKRGVAGRRLIDASGAEGKIGRYSRSSAQRLTPEGIYRVSATREEALLRLRQNGYLL